MEDTLWVFVETIFPDGISVLILILMEDTLWALVENEELIPISAS